MYARDHLWLEWYEDENAETYHKPAKIRDRWNKENPTQRIDFGNNGRELVKKSIAKAKRERGNVPPEN